MTIRPKALHDGAELLFLLFWLGPDRYALAVDDVGEILPMLEIKAVPGSPAVIAGLINYRGRPVPVLDISALTLGRPARHRLSTRIILIRHEAGNGASHWLGLIVEQATSMIRRSVSAFVPAGVDNDAMPYFGPVAPDADGLIQWIDPGKLLSPEICDMLFRSDGDAA